MRNKKANFYFLILKEFRLGIRKTFIIKVKFFILKLKLSK